MWRPLRLCSSAAAHLPPFLISTDIKRDSYTFHLTDFTNVWSESLDKHAIIERSSEEGTSIDPSQGRDQFQIFLDKIKSGLAAEKGTTLVLSINTDTDRPSLTLILNINLPGGLAPFVWPIRFSASPQSLLTHHLIIPLVRAQHARVQEIANLVEVLKEKDHVIQKLVDKMEEQGTDLGQVFPQAAGKGGRKLDRQRVEERVKGLGPFDMEEWRGGADLRETQDMAQLISAVFTGEGTSAVSRDTPASSSDIPEDWWDEMRGITVNLSTGKISTKVASRTPKHKPIPQLETKRHESIEEDDDFQVQSTPPHLRSDPANATTADDTTEDDDDDSVAPSQVSKVPDSFPASKPKAASPKQKKKLGGISGKKAASKSQRPVEDNDSSDSEPILPMENPKKTIPNRSKPVFDDDETTDSEPAPSRKNTPARKLSSPIGKPLPTKPQKKLGAIGKKEKAPPPKPKPETEDEEDEAPVSPPPKKATPPPEIPKAKKGKLGQVGGKKRQAASSPEEMKPELEPELSRPVTPKKKLGVIGHGHRAATEEKEVGTPENRGRASVMPEKVVTPVPRETTQERAARRREELLRELEQNAKAPVKKKRRF